MRDLPKGLGQVLGVCWVLQAMAIATMVARRDIRKDNGWTGVTYLIRWISYTTSLPGTTDSAADPAYCARTNMFTAAPSHGSQRLHQLCRRAKYTCRTTVSSGTLTGKHETNSSKGRPDPLTVYGSSQVGQVLLLVSPTHRPLLIIT